MSTTATRKERPPVRAFKIVLLVFSILLLSAICICGAVFILTELQPTAVQQLLRLTDLPQDLALAPEDPGLWGSHDFTLVEQALLHTVPVGSDQASIRAFLAMHQTNCETAGSTIRCQFYRDHFPCRTTIYLDWLLNEAGRLEHIHITDNTSCL